MTAREPKIILASASPRRAELLYQIGVKFELVPSEIEERPHPDEAPPDYITRIARAKVIAVARQQESGLIIGADTVVVLDGRLLGKPVDKEIAISLCFIEGSYRRDAFFLQMIKVFVELLAPV